MEKEVKFKSPYITIKQASLLLQFHEMTLYRLAKAGKLPALRLGGRWRINRDVLMDWAKRQEK